MPDKSSDRAKRTIEERNTLPARGFAEPGKRAWPIEHKAHARNAKARAAQIGEAGRILPTEADGIAARADAGLGWPCN